MRQGTEIMTSNEIKIRKGSVITLRDDRDCIQKNLGRVIFIGTNNFFDTNLGFHISVSEE